MLKKENNYDFRKRMLQIHDKNIRDWGAIKGRIRDDISRLMYERTKRSPMILPILMEI